MIWSKEEVLSREEIEELQLTRLQDTVRRIYEKVPYYKEKLDAAGVKPDDIKTLNDLRKLPFTVKDDLRNTYPFGLFTCPKEDLVRIHASSGTTGKPTVVGYTKKDLATWTELTSRIAIMGGASKDDVAQVAFGYGLFTGAFGLHYGLENIGASVIPTSSGNTERQIMLMKDFGSTLLVSTPSYALYMAEVAQDMGIDPKKDLNVKIGLFGGEGSTEAMREELNRKWGMFATENYGMSELMGPGVSGECEALQGMHIAEDHFIAEIIDPDTGEILPPGEYGELVITTITKEALPIIRYRTKDITKLTYETCKCGRTFVRMAKCQGRSDDMLIIRGVNVFPSQIEEIIIKTEGISPHYEILVDRKGYLDQMEIKVELEDDALLDSYVQLNALEQTLKQRLKTSLGIDATVKLVEQKSLQRFTGKSRRVTDLRKDDNN